MNTSILKKNLFAIAVGIAGFGVANAFNFPAPALTGPALFVSLAALLGADLKIHKWIQNMIFMLIGVAMGSSVTPDVISAAKQWPVSFVLLSANVVCIFLLCRYLLEHYWQVDRPTATLSSTPGHMSYILSLSVNSPANIGIVSVIQSIRVLSLTLVVPLITTMMGYEPAIPDSSPETLSFWPLLIVIVSALACGLVLDRINLAAAYLLAGMFVSSVVFVTGTVTGELPEYIYVSVIILMGTVIGTRLTGLGWNILKEAASSGLVLVVVAITISGLTALAYSYWSGLSFGLLLIAFAPGGLETMIAMSLVLDADPAFVAAHHVWRLLVLTILAPFMLAKQ